MPPPCYNRSAARASTCELEARPYRAPHHTASAVALVGGGSHPRPGEISMAMHGVLFLDELPEFGRDVLEVLREPLESGKISVSRAARQAEFPARFQLIAAMNPCPCGFLGHYSGKCHCTPDQVTRYRRRISGPLMDRIDLHIEVPAVPEQEDRLAPVRRAERCGAQAGQRCARNSAAAPGQTERVAVGEGDRELLYRGTTGPAAGTPGHHPAGTSSARAYHRILKRRAPSPTLPVRRRSPRRTWRKR